MGGHTIYTSGQLAGHQIVLPRHADRVQRNQAFSTMHLLQLTGPRVFILSSQNRKVRDTLWGGIVTGGELCSRCRTTSSGTSNLRRELILSQTCVCVYSSM